MTSATDNINNETSATGSPADKDDEIPTSWCVPSAGCHDDPNRNSDGNGGGGFLFQNLAGLVFLLACLVILFFAVKCIICFCLASSRGQQGDDEKTISVVQEEDEEEHVNQGGTSFEEVNQMTFDQEQPSPPP